MNTYLEMTFGMFSNKLEASLSFIDLTLLFKQLNIVLVLNQLPSILSLTLSSWEWNGMKRSKNQFSIHEWVCRWVYWLHNQIGWNEAVFLCINEAEKRRWDESVRVQSSPIRARWNEKLRDAIDCRQHLLPSSYLVCSFDYETKIYFLRRNSISFSVLQYGMK